MNQFLHFPEVFFIPVFYIKKKKKAYHIGDKPLEEDEGYYLRL